MARWRDRATAERHGSPASAFPRHPQGVALHVHRSRVRLCLGEASEPGVRRKLALDVMLQDAPSDISRVRANLDGSGAAGEPCATLDSPATA